MALSQSTIEILAAAQARQEEIKMLERMWNGGGSNDED